VSAPTFDLGRLHGGLRLDANKSQATSAPIADVPLPPQLILPLKQHAGEECQPLVSIGERVLRGQKIAEPVGTLGASVHATSSGTVVAVEAWPVMPRYGEPAPCIVIETDGRDEAFDNPRRPDWASLSSEQLLEHLYDGGLVGLGGAGFPTAEKLLQACSSDVDQLILNAVECEPYISCDDMLMREQADAIISGARILLKALDLDDCQIGIESDKPAAIDAMVAAIEASGDDRLSLKQVPTIYPSGGEDQLVQLLTRREVPRGGLPIDAGCLVQNVGTAAAVHDWIVDGQPLISRITTVTGDGISSPGNARVRLGTTIGDLVEAMGGYAGSPEALIVGGPMTGKSMSTDRVPVVKSTNCVLIMSAPPAKGPEMPCIRCGDCAAACPVQLMPQQLLWYANADNEPKLREYGLTDCIECGCCDLVCPSNIPLTFDFRTAKARIRELADEKARAERARKRFEARGERLERERAKRDAELSRQKSSAKRAGPSAIAEILARKRDAKQKNEAEGD